MLKLSNNAQIFYQLVKRDLYVMGQSTLNSFINSSIITTCLVLVYGHFFPALGMPHHLIGPLFIGTLTVTLFNHISSLSYTLRLEIQSNSLVTYQMILPLSKRWFFSKYIIIFALQGIITSLPLLIMGMVLLRPYMNNFSINIIPLFFVYIVAVILLSTFFTALSFLYDFEWAKANLWARRLDPLLFASTTFYTLQSVYAFSPRLAAFLLCNPLTYINEGLRAALFLDATYIHPLMSISILIVSFFGSCFLLIIGVKRRFDPI